MARLEFIDFRPWYGSLQAGGLIWTPDQIARSIDGMPQIYWRSGEGWAEANFWALEKATAGDVKLGTVVGLFKHLHAYAEFLEEKGLDWRDFPMRKADRVIYRFRGSLISQIEQGRLASSTASSRMGAVVQFYRYADAYGFVSPNSPMWDERSVVVPIHDTAGFQRSITRLTTDVSIPNRTRIATSLEDGLLPLSEGDMSRLLEFTSQEGTAELHLMLTVGFFTGARLGTLTSLRIKTVEQARPDSYTPGFFLMRVGPGTGVATKFDVQGDLLIPEFLLAELKRYAYSTKRLKREAKAGAPDKDFLFLTVRGTKYTVDAVGRLVIGLRNDALRSGLKFMQRFKFHQTRATYGTWLMRLALRETDVFSATEFVKSAMLHKHESTTFGYVKFLENSKGKQEASAAFSQAFTGLGVKDWSRRRA